MEVKKGRCEGELCGSGGEWDVLAVQGGFDFGSVEVHIVAEFGDGDGLSWGLVEGTADLDQDIAACAIACSKNRRNVFGVNDDAALS